MKSPTSYAPGARLQRAKADVRQAELNSDALYAVGLLSFLAFLIAGIVAVVVINQIATGAEATITKIAVIGILAVITGALNLAWILYDPLVLWKRDERYFECLDMARLHGAAPWPKKQTFTAR